MKKNNARASIEISAEEMLIIEDAFNEWCTTSNYVTGSWNTGDDDISFEHKKGEWWDFKRMPAIEQLKSIIRKKMEVNAPQAEK